MVLGKNAETVILAFIAVIVIVELAASLIPSLETSLQSLQSNITFGSTTINIEWLPLLMGFGALYVVIRYGTSLFRRG